MKKQDQAEYGGMAPPLSAGRLAHIACILEATARKPGNVHRDSDFPDLHYLDFLLSAGAIVQPLDRAGDVGVGATVLAAVEATRRVVCTNTNLGIILLLAPMAAVPGAVELASGLPGVLAATTIDDARDAYRAIRLAEPGGLGEVSDQDVAAEPTVTLRDAMELASGRDLVARQYASGFHEVLNEALPMLRKALAAGRPLETAIVEAFVGMLAGHDDTLIVRKAGPDAAAMVRRRAVGLMAMDWQAMRPGSQPIAEFDAWLRGPGAPLNPGATADLITAALFAALRDGTIQLPRLPGPEGWSAS